MLGARVVSVRKHGGNSVFDSFALYATREVRSDAILLWRARIDIKR